MAIYSTSIAELTRRVAEKTGPKKTAESPKKKAGKTVPEPAISAEESARDRTNRLARERRARKKQETIDQQAGVTLSTGQVKPPTRDPSDP